MFAQIWLKSAAIQRWPIQWRYRLPAVLAAGALFIQSAAPNPPQSFLGAEASVLGVCVPATVYPPALGSFLRQRPIELASWRGQNNATSPALKPVE